MASYIKTLKEDNGDITYPQTLASAVYTTGGTDVESALSSKASTTDLAGKIDIGDVQSTDIVANAVTTAKIADSNVTTAKINDGAVTAAKLDTEEYEMTSLPAHSSGTNSYHVTRVGNIVTINLKAVWLNSVAKDTWVSIGTLPAELVPASSDYEPAGSATLLNSNGNVSGVVELLVGTTTGALQIKSNTATSSLSAVRGSMSYVITW